MRETLIIFFLILTVLVAAYILCKCVWVAGNAKGFSDGYNAGERDGREEGSTASGHGESL